MAKKTKRSNKKANEPSSSSNSNNHNNGTKDPPGKKKNNHNARGKKKGKNHKSQWGTEDDINFRRSLEADGRYEILEMAADGNCLFRSLSDQLHHDHGNSHAEVRSAVCDYIEQHEEDFSVFLVLDDEDEESKDAADFQSYVATMREDGEWGGNLELVAAAMLYRRNITVFSANLSAMNIGHGEKKSSGPDLLLSYHDNDHYSSVRDATAPQTKSKVNGEENFHAEESKTGKKPKSPSKSIKSDGNESQSNETDKNQSSIPLPPNKNALCDCGSGKKYKRCCWTSARRETRARQGKGSDDSVSKTQESNDNSFEMNGNFRVLTI